MMLRESVVMSKSLARHTPDGRRGAQSARYSPNDHACMHHARPFWPSCSSPEALRKTLKWRLCFAPKLPVKFRDLGAGVVLVTRKPGCLLGGEKHGFR
jgi:hypothetical protein